MPEGGVINVSIENVVVKNKSYLPLPKGNYLKIMIKDHGTGIPEKLLPRIFEPYFTTKKKGSGLGLATAYSIIKNHGGYMTIESKLGEGTTIYIYIPATNAPLLEIDEQEDIRYTGGGRRILAMDDEEMIRKLLQNSLTEIGYRVELAGDGSEAIEKYIKAEKSGNPFAAVILDLTIPGGLGGKETIKKLLEINSNIIAIASSGYTNGPVMANYQEYGFRGTVSKPFHIADMEKTLHDVISTSEINTTMTRDVGVLPIPGNGQTRILIMDDSQVVISALSEILPEMGYEVEFARNGDQAISTYQKEKNSGYSFDIVIIDLNISKGLGGEETMKKLLEIDPKIQAIVSSGYPTEAAMLKPDKFGFKAAIAKPYRIEELSEIINKVMHKGNSQLVKGGGVSR
jgi:CheY-like chemotaxis protein